MRLVSVAVFVWCVYLCVCVVCGVCVCVCVCMCVCVCVTVCVTEGNGDEISFVVMCDVNGRGMIHLSFNVPHHHQALSHDCRTKRTVVIGADTLRLCCRTVFSFW